MDEHRQDPRRARRAAFVLAAVLAGTVLTGGAAVTGLTRHSPPAAALIVHQAPASNQQVPTSWEGDD